MRIKTWIVAGLSMAALVGVVGWAWQIQASLTKHRQPQQRLRGRRSTTSRSLSPTDHGDSPVRTNAITAIGLRHLSAGRLRQ